MYSGHTEHHYEIEGQQARTVLNGSSNPASYRRRMCLYVRLCICVREPGNITLTPPPRCHPPLPPPLTTRRPKLVTIKRFNFYAAAPARTDPSVCPEGKDAIMVLVPCPSIPDDFRNPSDRDDSGSDTAATGGPGGGAGSPTGREDWVRRAREGVIREMEASAGMEGFGDSIVGEEVYAPWDWRDR